MWTKNPSDFTLVVEGDIAQQRTRIALDALTGVILKSPVDTGRFRGAWTVSYNLISSVENPPSKSPQGAITNASAQLAAGAQLPYETVHIVNNVPYAGRLEDGSSQQAPNGVLAVTFNEIRVKYAL